MICEGSKSRLVHSSNGSASIVSANRKRPKRSFWRQEDLQRQGNRIDPGTTCSARFSHRLDYLFGRFRLSVNLHKSGDGAT